MGLPPRIEPVATRELVRRHPANPILSADDFPDIVNAVFNPGATILDNGDTLLLVRVEDRTGRSRLVVATSPDGYTNWTVHRDRGLDPDGTFAEHWGVEDPRITRIDDTWVIVYTGYSTAGPLVCLATTRDFISFERRGIVQSPEDKDAAVFPEKFDGQYLLIHRPVSAMSGVGAHMWISSSPDLVHWGRSRVLLPARRGAWWDANKVGLGPPPLRTDDGWLICYHGVRTTVSGSLYRVGFALLDLEDPSRLIARGNEWVFGPTAPYERTGDVSDVVFPCGWVSGVDPDHVRMYYGAADSTVCVADVSVRELLDHVLEHPCSPSPVEHT
jgi:predicted GH43/DUF377 family glycosyl hydrolase